MRSRRVNTPRLVWDRIPHPADEVVWPFFDQCYPESVMCQWRGESFPDPFGGAGRVCHHSTLDIWGLGVVDLGWYVTGEPLQDPCIANVWVDPRLIDRLAVGFNTHWPLGTHSPCQGRIGRMWEDALDVVALTAIGICDLACRMAPAHPTRMAMLAADHCFERVGPDRMIVSGFDYSRCDLRTLKRTH